MQQTHQHLTSFSSQMHGKDCLRDQEVNSLPKQSAKISMFVAWLVGLVLLFSKVTIWQTRFVIHWPEYTHLWWGYSSTLSTPNHGSGETSNTSLLINTLKEMGTAEENATFTCLLWWAWFLDMGKTSVPQQKVLLCSLCTSTLLVAEVNRIPHYTASATQQGNSSCLSPPWRSLAPQLQGPGTRLGEYPRITDVLPPSVPTDSVWLLPLPAPPGCPCSCPGEHRSHHAHVWVCWVQPGRQKGACCKQSLSARITWCKAWELLLEDTKAWQLIKAGGKENCSMESYYSHFNFPVEIIQWTSLPIVSQSAIKT